MLLNFILLNTASMPQSARPIIQPNTYYHIYN
jgi:hypothetical protein